MLRELFHMYQYPGVKMAGRYRSAVWLCSLIAALTLTGCGGGGGSSSQSSVAPPAACDPATTGLIAPLPVCSVQAPCVRPAPELNVAAIVNPSSEPRCDVPPWSEKRTQNVSGFTRYACVFRPPGTSAAAPRPLVVWFHPGGAGSADLASDETHLLDKAAQFDLSGDPARPGFILAAVQGRSMRFPTLAPRDGRHHDFYYRDLGQSSRNPDVANADTLIDTLVQEGGVDTNRIYVMGWSNGAFFSQLYSIARHQTNTPGGNRVAAAAVFSAADPFNDITWDPFTDKPRVSGPSCQLASYPVSTVPALMVYRSCDAAVPCDQVQGTCFDNEPGYVTESWLFDSAARGLSIQGLRIGGLESGAQLDAAAASCTDLSADCPTGSCSILPQGDACLCLVNHLRWPDAIYDSPPLFSNDDREIDMLNFLRGNPL